MGVQAKNIITIGFKNYIQPKRFYQELAESGYLEEFLKSNIAEKYDKDMKFRNEMQEILYKYSNKTVTDIEILNLEKLCESLGFFLELTKKWRNLTQ